MGRAPDSYSGGYGFEAHAIHKGSAPGYVILPEAEDPVVRVHPLSLNDGVAQRQERRCLENKNHWYYEDKGF